MPTPSFPTFTKTLSPDINRNVGKFKEKSKMKLVASRTKEYILFQAANNANAFVMASFEAASKREEGGSVELSRI